MIARRRGRRTPGLAADWARAFAFTVVVAAVVIVAAVVASHLLGSPS